MIQIKQISQKIKNAIIGEESSERKLSWITAQELLDDIFSIFQERLQEETTSEFLLFPTCFYIYLHEVDYNKRKEAFGHTVKGIVNMFHKDIRRKMSKYPDYIPHANNWRLQFLLFKEGMFVEDSDSRITVKQKEPFIISTIYSTNFSEGNFGSENIVGTINNRSSLRKVNYNVNRDALLGIDQMGGCFTVDFDKSFAKIENDIQNDDSTVSLEKRAKAILRITGGKFFGVDDEKNKYYMTSNELHISGRNDNRTSVTLLKIDSERVYNSHVRIKFFHETERSGNFSSEGGFKLAAFGLVKCNERKVPLSKGDEILWIDLYNNSEIFISDEISINFQIIKKQ